MPPVPGSPFLGALSWFPSVPCPSLLVTGEACSQKLLVTLKQVPRWKEVLSRQGKTNRL